MMIRLCAATLLGALLTGCVHVHVHNQEPMQGGLGLEPGDRVVARWRNGLRDATVLGVTGKLVRVAWDTPPAGALVRPARLDRANGRAP